MPIKVAIVEDNQDIREGLASLFRTSPGFVLACACESGEEALERIPRARPDVILMDVGLPGISGIEVIPRLKKLCPTTQVSMLSVFEDDEAIFKSLRAGATGYLLKKTPPTTVLQSVRELHEGGSPMSSQVARRVLRAFIEPPPVHPAQTGGAVASLSTREKQILELLAKGHRYKEIADQLGITIHTVRSFIRSLYEKLQVHSRTEALIKAHGGV